jgi:nucleoside-diphosphate-sugar epimerase
MATAPPRTWSRAARAERTRLVTGATGFAGSYLTAACEAAGDEVTWLSRATCDLLDAAAVRAAVGGASPQLIYHLAARAHVGESWCDPCARWAPSTRSTRRCCGRTR